MIERAALREKLRIKPADLEAVSDALASPDSRLVGGLLDLVERYGGVDSINQQAAAAGRHRAQRRHLLVGVGHREALCPRPDFL